MLSPQQIEQIISVFKPFNPTKLGIFGSYARGENTAQSDIDIMYAFQDGIGLFQLVKIKDTLEKLLDKKIDLVSEKYINEKIKPFISKDLKVIYKSK